MMELDDRRKTILNTSGHMLIKGGPGCGKTTIALLLAGQYAAELLAEQRVVFLSFSRAAVRQITDRMHDTLPHAVRQRLEIRTFHAFFMELVCSHSPQQTGVPATFITPERERRLRFDFDGDWRAHTEALMRRGEFVFDRLAAAAALMLESGRALRQLYSSTYPLVIVDEFQDSNVDQWRAVHALAEYSTIVCLADPDQRIFDGFVDGVDEHRIEHLKAALAPAEFDLSGDNHRSPAAGILDYANAVLAADVSVSTPDAVHVANYMSAPELAGFTHRALAFLDAKLRQSLGRPPTIAVLATQNATLATISEQLQQETPAPQGTVVQPIDHQLHFEPDVAAAAGYVVASILEWPGKTQIEATLDTLDRIIDFYRTVGTDTARKTANVLGRAREAVVSVKSPRSKASARLLELAGAVPEFNGDPIDDWKRVCSVLHGAHELGDVARRVRQLRLLSATDDLGWALLHCWDGSAGYPGAAAAMRQALADRLLDDSRAQQSRINLMNMHQSKGKEFDAVIVAEGRCNAKLLDREADFAPRSARRRLLRVGLTRAREQVLLLRPLGSVDLMATTKPAE